MLRKLCLIMLCVLILGGCSKEDKEIDNVVPDPLLLAFMPESLSGYSGDGGYYHESKRIESVSEAEGYWYYVSGEVKDNLTGYSKIDFKYQLNYLVNADKIIQTHEGVALNESAFTSIELLKLPIEKGHTWVFMAVDQTGKSVKVTGEIVEVSDDGTHVVVKHHTKDGYYEQRDLIKGLGVTDFIRQVIYKDESTLSGYHIDREAVITPVDNETEIEGIELSDTLYELILKFENAWPLYVIEADDMIFETVLPDSNAEQKIMSIIQMPTYDLEFVQFIPYEHVVVGAVHIIYVREALKDLSESVIENNIMFTIIEEADDFKIIDFEFIK